jgi:hypothetical protein
MQMRLERHTVASCVRRYRGEDVLGGRSQMVDLGGALESPRRAFDEAAIIYCDGIWVPEHRM